MTKTISLTITLACIIFMANLQVWAISGDTTFVTNDITQEKSEQLNISIPSGFFTQTFTITVRSTIPGDLIKYTLDGTDPGNSLTSLSGISPVNILIDPTSQTGGRGQTGGVVLRASKIEEGMEPGNPTTRTYIFPHHIITQSEPGGNWPTENINQQVIDYPMDHLITTDPRYANLMVDALLDIPSISMTTDPDHLFDPETGIYVNARYRGRDWERPANIELIHPDGSPGFNIDAGIRIRGGWSRHPEFAKHAFRVFFRSEYGESKLSYPLFGDEGVDEFDKIDFRTSQNYSWSKGGGEGVHNTMNRDVFSRDIQGAMDHLYTRSRYYHLYINGLYWGVFQTQERAEARFAESYLGGNRDDYDVVKVDVGDDWNIYDIEATDGNLDAWEEIWNRCQQGFASNENYFNLIGRNSAGERDTTLTVWVDIDNLIDYMLIIFYGGNFDAPVSKFRGNNDPNNFYAIFNRNRKDEGFKFLIHDAEHSLLTDAVGPGSGLHENRVNIGSIGHMHVSSFRKFHPQWLHHRLTQNPEYRMRFADRIYRHFFNDGVLTPQAAINRFMYTANQLELAIIAESARWGDMGVWTPRTKHDDWIPAVNRVINDFMPYRTEIVLDQLRAENLYVSLRPPVAKHNGVIITKNHITISDDYNLLLENPNSNGSIYYTIDGTDPRAVGGAFSAGAINGENAKSIIITPGSHLKARTRFFNMWSPLQEIYFQDAAIFENLKVTELHYNPIDQGLVNGQDLEFIELKNIGSTTLNLSGLTFTEGIYFNFPDGTFLEPNEFSVVASNREAFNGFYERPTNFEYTGRLSNSGEKIVLQTAHKETVLSFIYSDRSPWPVEADGEGYSLVSAEINPSGNPGSFEYWILSKYRNGSPFADDEASKKLVGLQQLVENQQAKIIDLNSIFQTDNGGSPTYQVNIARPAHAHVTLNGNLLSIQPLKRGDTHIHLTVNNGIDEPFISTFRVLVYPAAHICSGNSYSFHQWAPTEPEYSYPEHMIFLQTDANDPGIDYPLIFPYFVNHNDYHANDQNSIGFPYASTGRTRINALGKDGISFINTARQRDLGGAVLALDTRNVTNLQLEWTGGTVLQNQRIYAIRLQYRTSINSPFVDLTIDGQVQEYMTHTTGHSRTFGAVRLPQELLGKEYLQLLWRYYHVMGSSGPRAELRLDNINIGTTVNVMEGALNFVKIYTSGQSIVIDLAEVNRANMKVYNITGQELINTSLNWEGIHTINTQLPAGIYIVRLESPKGFLSKKVIIAKR